jgi:orotate phosphoribosyltransferase
MDREALGRALVSAAYLEGDFLLSSGRRSRYYFDKYLFETDPSLLRPIAEHLAAMLPSDTERLAGPELGGVALAAAVSLQSGLPFVIVRRAAKDYGGQKLVEGVLHPGERVTVLEDVLTTGRQAIEAAQSVQEAGAEVLTVLGVVDREEGAAAGFTSAGFLLRSLFTRSELDTWREPRAS